jgi:hypothetical protein
MQYTARASFERTGWAKVGVQGSQTSCVDLLAEIEVGAPQQWATVGHRHAQGASILSSLLPNVKRLIRINSAMGAIYDLSGSLDNT